MKLVGIQGINEWVAEARRNFPWFSAAILGTCEKRFPVLVVE
jgi:hypothetical protein